METAKLFRHGGSQAVRLPKKFRFAGREVEIERRGEEVVLRPKAAAPAETLVEVARWMNVQFPQAVEFPDREQPRSGPSRDLDLD
jgi:antitoxin VapB